MTVSIIFGYGVYLDGDEKYQDYLDRAIEILEQNPSEFIITCGTDTNVKYPFYSEAESIANYIASKKLDWRVRLNLEEKSLTAAQKIQNSRQIIAERGLKPNHINIICDSVEIPKTILMSLSRFDSLLGNNMTEEMYYRALMHSTLDLSQLDDPVKREFGKITFWGLTRSHTTKEIGLEVVHSLLEIGLDKHPALLEEFVRWRQKMLMNPPEEEKED